MQQITHKVISQVVVGTDRLTSFSETLDVPFMPTHIKISNIYYEADPNDSQVYILSSNLINSLDNRLGVIVDGLNSSEPIIFTNDKPVSGSYDFNVNNGGLRAGSLSMTVTFMRT
jgi:hypothetical protein